MAHFPVDHPLRPLYRILTGLIAIYLLVFGVIGVTQTTGTALFEQTGLPRVMGLRTNLGFAILSVAAGAALLAGCAIGRNIDVLINTIAGITFWVAGSLMLLLIRTDANFLGSSVATAIMSYLLGTVVLCAGMYGRGGKSTRDTTPRP